MKIKHRKQLWQFSCVPASLAMVLDLPEKVVNDSGVFPIRHLQKRGLFLRDGLGLFNFFNLPQAAYPDWLNLKECSLPKHLKGIGMLHCVQSTTGHTVAFLDDIVYDPQQRRGMNFINWTASIASSWDRFFVGNFDPQLIIKRRRQWATLRTEK